MRSTQAGMPVGTEDDDGSKQDEEQGGKDVGEREGGVRGEDVVECRQLGRSVARWGGEGDDAAQDDGDGDDDADPETGAEPERSF